MPNWKKVIVSGSAANLVSLNVDTFITASTVSANEFTGSLYGTASQAISSSYSDFALTASYALNGGGGSGGGATTGSNTFIGDQTISGSLTVTGSSSANIFLFPQTASDFVVPSGHNGLLVTPVQLIGSSSVETGARLVIL